MSLLDAIGPLDALGALGKLASLANAPDVASAVVAKQEPEPSAWGRLSLSNLVVIILGLLLITAGLFTFDKTKHLVVGAAKAGAAAVA